MLQLHRQGLRPSSREVAMHSTVELLIYAGIALVLFATFSGRLFD
jgi:hypothetical protein